MSSPKHDPQVYVKLAEANPFFSNKKIADLLGVDEASVRRAYKKAGYKRGLIPPNEDIPRALETVDIPITLYWDALLIADVHCPLYDREYIYVAIKDAINSGIGTVVFCGDFWQGDQYSNYFPKQITLESELSGGVELMEWILGFFDKAYFIKGNHDYRYVKVRGYKVSFVQAMQDAFKGLSAEAMDKIEFSNLDHMYLTGPFLGDLDGTQDWYVCHPQAYSRQPLAGARALTTIHDMNVATAHSHHCARGYGPNGKHQAMELGGFFDVSRTAYLQASTAFPKSTPGYAIYQDGKMRLESPAWS